MERPWLNRTIIRLASKESWRAKRDSKKSSSVALRDRAPRLLRDRRRRPTSPPLFRHQRPSSRREARNCIRGCASGPCRPPASRSSGRAGVTSRVPGFRGVAPGAGIRGWGFERSGVPAAYPAPIRTGLLPISMSPCGLQRAVRSDGCRQRRVCGSCKALKRRPRLLRSAPAHARHQAIMPIAPALRGHGQAANQRALIGPTCACQRPPCE
jgi:hypothetical protein